MKVDMISQLPLDLKFAPAMGRHDFMVGECNHYAAHLIETWPKEWTPYPAMTLYGPKGCGKSHLAAVWQNISQARGLNLEEFSTCDVEELINAKENLVIDHLEFLIGDRTQEEKLFHLYNAFQQQGLYFLGLSSTSPEKLKFEIRDLESRLRSAQSAEIKPPDDELLIKVMAKRFFDQSFKIDQDSLEYILLRMERSWDGLDRLVEKVSSTATALKKGELTKPLLRTVMTEDAQVDY
ncbi:MAG: DNA replication protein [Alphaproteobacteria bacterium]|nr:DNA replication protein [Alphaproteobacteria bacterium]